LGIRAPLAIGGGQDRHFLSVVAQAWRGC